MRRIGQLSTAAEIQATNLQKLSSLKVSRDSMISRAMKSHKNEQTVHGRPTLKNVKRFRNGSFCQPYEPCVNLSRMMLNQRSYHPPPPPPRGEPNEDVPLNGVAFSRLD